MPTDFRYENYRSPYIQPIGELMRASGDQQAQLQLQIANINARQLETNALIKARAIGNIGQAAANIGEGIERERREAPARQFQQLQLGQAKQELVDNQVLRQAMAMPPDQAQKYLEGLGPVGVGAKQKYAGFLSQQREQQQKIQAQQDKAFLPFARSVASAKDPLAAFDAGASEAIQRGLMTRESALATRQQFGDDPEQARSWAEWRMGYSEEGRETLDKTISPRPGAPVVQTFTGKKLIEATPGPGSTSQQVEKEVQQPDGSWVKTTLNYVPSQGGTGGKFYTLDGTQAVNVRGADREGTSQEKPKLVLENGKWVERQLDYVPGVGGPAKWFYQGKEVDPSLIKDKPSASMVIFREKEQTQDKTQDNIVRMLRAGRITPMEISKRGDFNEIMGLADAQSIAEGGPGFDASKANLQHQAQQRFYKGLNSDQQTKYRADGLKVQSTIAELQDLGNQLQQGNVQLWNKAKRSTAEQLFSGTPQGILARRYNVALKTLEEEFARMVTGGYAPTEAAFKLAHEQIRGDVSLSALTAQLDEVNRLIGFGLKAPSQLGVQLPGQSGIPEPETGAGGGGAGAGRIRVVGPNGQTGTMLESEALPAGWKRQ